MIDMDNKELLEQYLLDKGVVSKEQPYEINYCKGANNSDYWGHVASAAGLK